MLVTWVLNCEVCINTCHHINYLNNDTYFKKYFLLKTNNEAHKSISLFVIRQQTPVYIGKICRWVRKLISITTYSFVWTLELNWKLNYFFQLNNIVFHYLHFRLPNDTFRYCGLGIWYFLIIYIIKLARLRTINKKKYKYFSNFFK